jgi:hypothetical protein
MKQQVRMDRVAFQKPVRMDNGFMRVPITVTRVGIFVYRLDDGTEWREFRPESEVFDPASMGSLKGVPATNEHPSFGLITADNARDVMIGYTSDEVQRVDETLASYMTITEAGTIKEVERGDKQEVSAGYLCDLEIRSGTWRGERYDAIQRRIRYNHVAITGKGRAGPEVRIHLDSADKVMRLDSVLNPVEKPIGDSMEKSIILNGVEYKVSNEAYAAITGRFNADSQTITGLTDKLKAADDEKQKAQARADSLQSDLQKAKEAVEKNQGLRADSAEFREAVQKRVKLEVFASKRMDTDLGKMSDKDIIVALIKLDSPEFKEEGRSDVYLQARLDAMLERDGVETEEEEEEEEGQESRTDSDDDEDDDLDSSYNRGKRAISRNVRSDAKNARKDGKQELSGDEKRLESMRAQAEAYKKPIGMTRKA